MRMGNARGFIVAGVLLIVTTTLGVPAQARSMRNGASPRAITSSGGPGEVLWTYYDTSGAPGGGGNNLLTLINPNGSANSGLGASSDVCAMIYVFDDDQEMGECCGCPISPAGIQTFGVDRNFTSNWVGVDDGNGAIAIVAAPPNVPVVAGSPSNGHFCLPTQSGACNGGCDPTGQPGYSVSSGANLLGSIVHDQLVVVGTCINTIAGLTEVPLFDDAGGDPNNLTYLQAQCGALVGNGTGAGICDCSLPPPPSGTPTPTPTATATPSGNIVFVTSAGFTGNLGGTAGGDTKCNNLASAAHLPGTYKAWLSTATPGDNPASSFTQSTMPYVLVDGTHVAENWAGLVSGTLEHGIDEDEHGTITTQSSVWTGTNANGTAPTFPQQVLDCFGWSDTTDLAYDGSPAATNSNWSIQSGLVCNNLFPLYCFRQ